MNRHDHWPEAMSGPLPECFASMQEAFDAYAEAQENGFDGNYNEYLDMERHRIAVDHALNELNAGAESLFKLGELAWLRKVCGQWLDRAS